MYSVSRKRQLCLPQRWGAVSVRHQLHNLWGPPLASLLVSLSDVSVLTIWCHPLFVRPVWLYSETSKLYNSLKFSTYCTHFEHSEHYVCLPLPEWFFLSVTKYSFPLILLFTDAKHACELLFSLLSLSCVSNPSHCNSEQVVAWPLREAAILMSA